MGVVIVVGISGPICPRGYPRPATDCDRKACPRVLFILPIKSIRNWKPSPSIGVPPVSWTPNPLGEWRTRCQEQDFAYPPEFRQQIVELHRAGSRPGELAREFEPNEQTIRNWIAQADLDEGRRRDGLTTVERAELRKLRKENRQLRVEREILAKAAAWFARESDPISKKSSGS